MQNFKINHGQRADGHHLLVFVMILATLVSACSKQPPSGAIPAGTVTDWPAWGATPGGTHFSQADQITPANVHLLKIAWEHHSGDIRKASDTPGNFFTKSALEVTPIVVGDRLYYCSPFDKVFALNAETGQELWAFDPKVDHNVDYSPVCRGVGSWQSGEAGFCEQRIFVATLDERLIALDAETGKRCPDFGTNGEVDLSRGLSKHEPWEYSVNSPPAILGDRVITGSSILDNQRVDAPSGVVRAYDIRSGELLWAWVPVKPGNPTVNEDGTYRNGTANVWSISAVDSERDLVILPTGSAAPDYYGVYRDGLDYYASSVVALHGKTGEVAWHFQLVHHDLWDYDAPAQPTLVDMTVNGETVPVVVQVTKMGRTFVLNRDTGEPVWPVEERPVPQNGLPEETLSPTQPFPAHVPYLITTPLAPRDAWGFTFWDKGQCAGLIAGMQNDGWYTPPSLKGSVNYPSEAGGNNWGSPSINPFTRMMVVYTVRAPGFTRLKPRAQCSGSAQLQSGAPYCVDSGWLLSPLGVPCGAPPWGTLDAIDLEAGKLLWSVPMGTTRNMAPFPFWWFKGIPGIAAPMLTATGLIFSGVSGEHVFRAFDVRDGSELWHADLPTAANALPLTYQVRATGKQYVVVAAGGHWAGGSPAGDGIIAFALPDPGN